MTEKEMPFHQFVVSSEKAKKKTIQICRNKQKQVGNANRLKPKRFFHLVFFFFLFFFISNKTAIEAKEGRNGNIDKCIGETKLMEAILGLVAKIGVLVTSL